MPSALFTEKALEPLCSEYDWLLILSDRICAALHMASANGHEVTVSFLLKAGAVSAGPPSEFRASAFQTYLEYAANLLVQLLHLENFHVYVEWQI